MSLQQDQFSLDYCLPPQKKAVQRVDFSANDKEKEELAQIVEIESLQSLKASFSIERKNMAEATLSGHIWAEITQLCVISLESITSQLDFSFQRLLVKELTIPSSVNEEEWENLESEQDVWDGKNIDLAHIIVEELLINIDSYPRKEGLEASHTETVETSLESQETTEKNNPFAVLSQLKTKK